MMLAARGAFLTGNKSPQLSLSKSGTSQQGFFVNSLGSLPMNQTFTCWYKATFTDADIMASRDVFKYGDNNNGCGFGFGYVVGGNTRTSKAALVEAKYWWTFDLIQGVRLPNTGWHHLAYRIKSGTSPNNNAVFVDGTVQTRASNSSSSTSSINPPTNIFSICGRGNGGTLDCEVRVYHPRIYNELLSDSKIAEDMTIAGVPTRQSLVHYWDGTTDGGKVYDFVGDWHLSFSDGCSVVPDTPQGGNEWAKTRQRF